MKLFATQAPSNQIAERIQLLVHILKLIVEPTNKQCSSVQKLQLNVKKLEEVTMKALSPWFSDPDHPDNAHKKVYLKEIFKVAKAQERYKNGEIGELSCYSLLNFQSDESRWNDAYPSPVR